MISKHISLLLVGAVGVLVLLGGIFWWQREASVPTETPSETPSQQQESQHSFTGSFLELAALGENFTCDFSVTDEENQTTTGTVYIADQGDRLYGSFMSTHPEREPMESSILRDGEYFYMWSPAMEQGYKAKIDPESESLFMDSGSEDTETTTFDDTQPVDFECQNWSVDPARFVPPSDVTFVDFSEQMQLMQESMQNSNSENTDQCAACQQVPAGQSRDQCLQALGCN